MSKGTDCGAGQSAVTLTPVKPEVRGEATTELSPDIARTVLSPAVSAQSAILKFSGLFGTTAPSTHTALLSELEAQIAAIKEGQSDRMAEILAAHIETLNALFYGFVESAYAYRGGPYQTDKLKLAFRAQSRLVATMRALVEIKQPRAMAYAQQANVGNAVRVMFVSGVGNTPNEVLEQQRNEWLDRRTADASVGADQELATVGQIHRAKDDDR